MTNSSSVGWNLKPRAKTCSMLQLVVVAELRQKVAVVAELRQRVVVVVEC